MIKIIFCKKVLVMILVLGLMVSWSIEAQSDRRLNGTWICIYESIEIEMVMNNGSYEEKNNNIPAARGTYTTNNGEIISIPTHIYGGAWNAILDFDMLESKWYTRNEFIIAVRTGLLGFGLPEGQINELITPFITPPVSSYSVDANSIILSYSLLGQRIVLIYNRK